jgi:hypothetical protein
MSRLNKLLVITGLLVFILINAVLYWGQHLYYHADRESNEDRKMQLLQTSAEWVPFDAKVYLELGNMFHEKADRNLDEPAARTGNLELSIQNYRHSIRMNPGSYEAHYALGRALLYLSYLQPENHDFFQEYWKAAQLTTFDNEIYFEIGRILFSLWTELADSQKSFTLDILNNVIQTKNNERLWRILQTWAANVMDYEVIEDILPETPSAYRMYARFLGERSLALENQQLRLAQAEYMEFEAAKVKFSQAQSDFRLYRLQPAANKYLDSNRMLQKIYFYQNLLPERSFIDAGEYGDLFKLSLLGVIQSTALQENTIEAVKEYFDRYLEIEDDPATLERLEEFFEEKNWLELKPGSENNALRMYYRINLDYKQSRFREIAGLAHHADEMEYNYQEKFKDELQVIYRLIGDSYQKIDFLYDAVDYYRKALQLSPNDVKTLVQLRNSYLRLNNEEKLAEINAHIEKLMAPPEEIFENLKVMKNTEWRFPLLIEPGKVRIRISIFPENSVFAPLVSIYLNGEVVYEEYLENKTSGSAVNFQVRLNSLQNDLRIIPVNQDVFIRKINLENIDD